MVDPSAVAAALAATLSPDMAVNSAAQASLKSLEGAAGFGVTLLRVAEAPSVELPTRQAAATFFKNFVKRQWADADSGVIAPADRDVVKSTLVRLMTCVARAHSAAVAAASLSFTRPRSTPPALPRPPLRAARRRP